MRLNIKLESTTYSTSSFLVHSSTQPKKIPQPKSSTQGTRVFVAISSVSCPFLDPRPAADPGRSFQGDCRRNPGRTGGGLWLCDSYILWRYNLTPFKTRPLNNGVYNLTSNPITFFFSEATTDPPQVMWLKKVLSGQLPICSQVWKIYRSMNEWLKIYGINVGKHFSPMDHLKSVKRSSKSKIFFWWKCAPGIFLCVSYHARFFESPSWKVAKISDR